MRTKQIFVIGVLVLGLAAFAFSKGAAVIGNVFLQDTSPGTVQLGHAAITGTFKAGQIVGTSLHASTTPIIGNNTSSDPNAMGGTFSTFSQSGIGIRSTATNNTGTSSAIYAEARGANGRALDCLTKGTSARGINVLTTGTFATGVYSETQGFDATAGFFKSPWIGVGASGVNDGIYSTCFTNEPGNILHAALRAEASNANVGPDYGVYSTATNNGAGTCYGVAGDAFGSGTNWGIYSYGNSGATGTKSFEIDHPLSPETETLRHYSAEGAEPLLVYSGNAKLDAHGKATVQMADYVDAIGRDFRYQLTPVGAPMPNLYVSRTFVNNVFGIAGGVPGQTVSWTLTGVRNDRWVQKHGAPVEVPKPPEMQGHYLQPELYGLPRTAGIRELKSSSRK